MERKCSLGMLLAASIALFAFEGCTSELRHVPIDTQVVRPEKAVVVFFADGVNKDRLEEMIAAGELPNIKERFVDGGVTVKNAVTVLPSITYAVSVSMLTGLFPGHHGILGNRWFDPLECIARYYITASTYRTVNQHFHRPTLYEVLSDCFTVNVQFHSRRGVTYTIDNAIPTGINYFLETFWWVDERVGRCVVDVERLANRVGRWPVVYWNYFPGIDETAHANTTETHRYRRELTTIDTSIGQVLEGVERAGMADSTYYVFMTDHGHNRTEPGHELDLAAWIAQTRDLRVFTGAITFGDYPSRLRRIQKYDAVVLTGASRRVAIYLPGRNGWGTPVDTEAIDAVINGATGAEPMWALPSVEVVCAPRGRDAIEVLSKAGKVAVERRRVDDRKEYRALGDVQRVLGYTIDGWHDADAWLSKTASTGMPDFVPQVVEMFDSPRAGNIVVFAAEGWTFGLGDASGHGSCIAADMRVPLYFAGPDLPAGGSIDCARVVDVMPTIVDLLDRGDRLAEIGRLDGKSIANELHNASVRDNEDQ